MSTGALDARWREKKSFAVWKRQNPRYPIVARVGDSMIPLRYSGSRHSCSRCSSARAARDPITVDGLQLLTDVSAVEARTLAAERFRATFLGKPEPARFRVPRKRVAVNDFVRLLQTTWTLKRGLASLTRSHANCLLQIQDKDLPVADLSRASHFGYRIDGPVQ